MIYTVYVMIYDIKSVDTALARDGVPSRVVFVIGYVSPSPPHTHTKFLFYYLKYCIY